MHAPAPGWEAATAAVAAAATAKAAATAAVATAAAAAAKAAAAATCRGNGEGIDDGGTNPAGQRQPPDQSRGDGGIGREGRGRCHTTGDHARVPAPRAPVLEDYVYTTSASAIRGWKRWRDEDDGGLTKEPAEGRAHRMRRAVRRWGATLVKLQIAGRDENGRVVAPGLELAGRGDWHWDSHGTCGKLSRQRLNSALLYVSYRRRQDEKAREAADGWAEDGANMAQDCRDAFDATEDLAHTKVVFDPVAMELRYWRDMMSEYADKHRQWQAREQQHDASSMDGGGNGGSYNSRSGCNNGNGGGSSGSKSGGGSSGT